MEVSPVFGQIPALQPSSKKPGQLTEEQLKQFFSDGYVIVENYFTDAELQPVKHDFEETIDELAKSLFDAGKIKDLYRNYGFKQRLVKIEQDFPGATLVLAKFGYLSKGWKGIYQSDKILNAMEQILGTEDIMANPVYFIRYKLPNNDDTTIPWHQDASYFDDNAKTTLLAKAWIPLVDVSAKNGAMQVLKGANKSGKLAPHTGCWKDTIYIESSVEDMEKTFDMNVKKETVTCNVPYKGIMFITNLTPFTSPANTSDEIRWTFEMRYQKKDEPFCLYDLTDGIQLRSSEDPNFKPDWSKMPHESDIKTAVDKSTMGGTQFMTTHYGPWMGKWPMVNPNKHTDAYFECMKKTGGKPVSWHASSKANEICRK